MERDIGTDALIVGAGPAGCAAAILLARADWRVVLVEKMVFPRRKVCGECIAPGNLALLDELGVGGAFRRSAGPQFAMLGWMRGAQTTTAAAPVCYDGPYRHGRALGRDQLDVLLLERARSLGVRILQPAKLLAIGGQAPHHECTVKRLDSGRSQTIRTPVVIDAHGSWEGADIGIADTTVRSRRQRHRASDLFAFKANFLDASLAPNMLSVVALPGGYGGIALGNDGKTTLAVCVRRDVLAHCRERSPGATAGAAVEGFLLDSCHGVRDALHGSVRDGGWLSAGPLRPGIRVDSASQAYRVGNAAGEAHPLIGEGISMALQSSVLLSERLTRHRPGSISPAVEARIHRQYAADWRRIFAPRLRLAALYAHIAMRPRLSAVAAALLVQRPGLLTQAARWASKARGGLVPQSVIWEGL